MRRSCSPVDFARDSGEPTATVHAESDDGLLAQRLLPALTEKAGRVLFNGYPTGVEVCDAMVHGGPWPATTDARGTSVGTIIDRFLRPVCLQNVPAALLPPAVQDDNPLNLLRLINGQWTRKPFPPLLTEGHDHDDYSTHQTQARVAEVGKFKKQLTLTDLTFIGLGAIFGSRLAVCRKPCGIDRRTCWHCLVGHRWDRRSAVRDCLL